MTHEEKMAAARAWSLARWERADRLRAAYTWEYAAAVGGTANYPATSDSAATSYHFASVSIDLAFDAEWAEAIYARLAACNPEPATGPPLLTGRRRHRRPVNTVVQWLVGQTGRAWPASWLKAASDLDWQQ